MAKDRTDVDPQLKDFVYAANKHGVVMPLTLFTQNFVVVGWLASYKTYKQQLKEIYNDDLKNPEAVVAQVAKLIEIFDHEHQSDDYIHLQWANWLEPHQYMLQDGRPWRGKIKHVQSYIVGHTKNPSDD